MADAPGMHVASQPPLGLGERGLGILVVGPVQKTTPTRGLGLDSRHTILGKNGCIPEAETPRDALSDSEPDAPTTPPLNELVQQELLELAEHEENIRSRLSVAAQLLGQCQASPQISRAAQPVTREQACGDDTPSGSPHCGLVDRGALTAAISSFVDTCLESLGNRVLQTSERHEARMARLAACVERVSAARIPGRRADDGAPRADDGAPSQKQVI